MLTCYFEIRSVRSGHVYDCGKIQHEKYITPLGNDKILSYSFRIRRNRNILDSSLGCIHCHPIQNSQTSYTSSWNVDGKIVVFVRL